MTDSVQSTDNLSMNTVEEETSSGRRRSGRIHKAPDYYANAFTDDTSTTHAESDDDDEKLASSGKVSQKKRKSTDSSATESAKGDKRSRLSDVSLSSVDSGLSSPATSPGMSTFESLQKAQLDTTSAEWTSQNTSASKNFIDHDSNFVVTDTMDEDDNSALLSNDARVLASKSKKPAQRRAPARQVSAKQRSSVAATNARRRTRAKAIESSPEEDEQADSSEETEGFATSAVTISLAEEDQKIQRPKPYGIAPVHAESRQDLCDSLPYYHAFQSGAYTQKEVGWGMLLGRDAGARPYMDEEVVITRAGGGCKKNAAGKLTQVASHSDLNASIKAFMKSLEDRRPLALIVGRDNDSCPVEIPHEYCVMDFFVITNTWEEDCNGLVVRKWRFEKVDLDHKSWWAAEGSPKLPARVDRITGPLAARETCPACLREFPQVFAAGWMCLNGSCQAFWTNNGVAPSADLSYNKDFLRERQSEPPELRAPYCLAPEVFEVDQGNESTYAYSRGAFKGIVCPNCHRCISRKYWDGWRCETQDCGFVHSVHQPVISAQASCYDGTKQYDGHAPCYDEWNGPVAQKSMKVYGDWVITTYQLMDGNVIAHLQANKHLNRGKGGADQAFMDLQRDNCMGLQRHKRPQSTLKGDMLSGQFTKNFGLPYKYVTETVTAGFSEAPVPILAALKRLSWAGRKIVGENTFQAFNELLAVGYFECGKMDFHDDGESTLGPTVATWSLGAPATMLIRMKERYWKGLTKNNKYNPKERVVPGAALEQERTVLNALHGKISDEEFERRRTKLYNANISTVRSHKPVLTMPLKHGDIVVMHGAEMQKYFE
ncbi:MAG: hypothetical protein Q9187_004357, partial [Circinaria calcarea]